MVDYVILYCKETFFLLSVLGLEENGPKLLRL